MFWSTFWSKNTSIRSKNQRCIKQQKLSKWFAQIHKAEITQYLVVKVVVLYWEQLYAHVCRWKHAWQLRNLASCSILVDSRSLLLFKSRCYIHKEYLTFILSITSTQRHIHPTCVLNWQELGVQTAESKGKTNMFGKRRHGALSDKNIKTFLPTTNLNSYKTYLQIWLEGNRGRDHLQPTGGPRGRTVSISRWKVIPIRYTIPIRCTIPIRSRWPVSVGPWRTISIRWRPIIVSHIVIVVIRILHLCKWGWSVLTGRWASKGWHTHRWNTVRGLLGIGF